MFENLEHFSKGNDSIQKDNIYGSGIFHMIFVAYNGFVGV